MTAHGCGSCGRRTKVVRHDNDGLDWAHDYGPDGFTASPHVHQCGPNGRLHVRKAEAPVPLCGHPVCESDGCHLTCLGDLATRPGSDRGGDDR